LLTSLSIGGTTLSFSKYYYYSLVLTLILSTTVILMNVICIPIWGINGAAIATLFASCIYYLLLLALVFWKLKVIPLSGKHFNVLVIIMGLFLLDYLWKQYVTPLIIQNPTLWVSFFEALLRTTLLGGIGFLCVYFGNISEEMNKVINKLRIKN